MARSKEVRVQVGKRLYGLVPMERLTLKNMSGMLDKYDVYLLTRGK
jgi:hypothetical protein